MPCLTQITKAATCSAHPCLFSPSSSAGPLTTVDDFEVLKPIGEGAYGKVFLVRKKESGTLFAMKTLKAVEHTRSESTILSQLDNPFIVALHFIFQTKENLRLILQYAPGGSLFSYLAKERMFSETQASFYIGEILLALEHVHAQGIIYRDLKPENVLLDLHGHVLLTDFGLSKVVMETRTVCGTIDYMAPEVLSETLLYGRAVDFWSLGIVLFDFLAGSPPFKGNNRKKIMDAIMHQKPKFPKFFSPQATNLIGKLLVKDPSHRIGCKLGAAEIKKHSFFRKTDWNEEEKVDGVELELNKASLCLKESRARLAAMREFGIKPAEIHGIAFLEHFALMPKRNNKGGGLEVDLYKTVFNFRTRIYNPIHDCKLDENPSGLAETVMEKVLVVADAKTLRQLVSFPAFNDRPEDLVLANILLGGMPTLTHHTLPRFKAFRRLVQLSLTKTILRKHDALFTHETKAFLRSLVPIASTNEPNPVKDQVHKFSFSMIIHICFAVSMHDLDKDFMPAFFHNTDQSFLLAGAATDKAAFFPILNWFPDPNIQKAKRVRETGSRFISQLMHMTEQKFTAQKANNASDSTDSFSTAVSHPESPDSPLSIMELVLSTPSLTTHLPRPALTDALNNLTIGAIDTVAIAIQWAFAYLATHPHIQSDLHTELDNHLHRSTLPTLADEPHLPLLNAFLRETQRMRPVSATAVPRATLSDQQWQGYLIPKGTWLMFDFYGLARDVETYGSDVDTFRPDRYIDPFTGGFNAALDSFNPAGADTTSHPRSFSFGRRVCPGKELAQMQLFMAIAGVCQCFVVEQGDEGVDLDAMCPGLTNPPKGLKVVLRERFEGAFGLFEEGCDSEK
ncbi:Ribosomal protein S6 kinase beta-1 [Podochytrium sp. JEL0797]|nr:Ribosomal protein S6 kinase beta-1 [Podochytrium sp. JEL0797]